jgi:DHA1 family multidrug resistance protein-like MFS transporter
MSGIVLISALIILFTVSEKFERASGKHAASPSGLWQLAISKEMLPLLIIVFAIFTGPSMITLIIPLSVSEISPHTAAATYSGIALGLKGLLSVIASISISRFGQRLTLKRTMLTAAFLAGIAYSLPMFVTEISVFVILIGMTGLFVGALQTTSNTLIGLSVPRERQGTAYGLASSATSLGFGGGGFAGGSLAAIIGFRPIFGITGMLFIVVGFLVLKLIKR